MTLIALTLLAVFAFGVWLVRLRHQFLGSGVVYFRLFLISMWMLLPTESGESGAHAVADGDFRTATPMDLAASTGLRRPPTCRARHCMPREADGQGSCGTAGPRDRSDILLRRADTNVASDAACNVGPCDGPRLAITGREWQLGSRGRH